MNQKIIIFDSPDGTGKSNIAFALSKVINIPYFKMNTEHQNWRKGKFKDALEFDQTYLFQLLKQVGFSVIIDRAYPAEWVYSKVYKRFTSDSLLFELDRNFADLGATIVIPLRRDYSRNREDELVKNDELYLLHDKYIDFTGWTKCKTVLIFVDDFKDDLQSELDYLIPKLL